VLSEPFMHDFLNHCYGRNSELRDKKRYPFSEENGHLKKYTKDIKKEKNTTICSCKTLNPVASRIYCFEETP
jgi:Rps23 Pro-64 3,4-dihydroxylase Tpa1-like proline 4-hydroxylase